MEQELYELDMERQYEDQSFILDEINLELQATTEESTEAAIEAVYDEFLDEMLRLYYPPVEYDFENV